MTIAYYVKFCITDVINQSYFCNQQKKTLTILRQGDAGMYHRYVEAHKGNPETESHHSRIYSAQKFQLIIYIPMYMSCIPN